MQESKRGRGRAGGVVGLECSVCIYKEGDQRHCTVLR